MPSGNAKPWKGGGRGVLSWARESEDARRAELGRMGLARGLLQNGAMGR